MTSTATDPNTVETSSDGHPIDPDRIEWRTELLAVADADAVRDVAERCLAEFGPPVVVAPPETGIVMLQVREPVARERFHLGEVVVTRADVEMAGHRGWCMRQGTDRTSTLAAAICEAVARSGGDLGRQVEELCAATASEAARVESELIDTLQPTIVAFEELD